MAKLYTVEDIKDLDEDSVVQRFEGTIVTLYEQKSGENKNGDWSLQNMEVKDADGDKIKVTLKDRDELPRKWKGREITILAHKGDKGWSGVYAKDDDYHDKKNPDRILWVTRSAEIAEAGSDGGGREEDSDRRERRRDDDGDRRERRRDREEENEDRGSRNRGRDREEDRGEREERRERRRESDPEQDAKDLCLKLSNAGGLAMEAAFYTAQAFEARNGVTVPIEFIQALTMWMLISGDRKGTFDGLPTESIFPDPEERKEDGGKGKEREENEDRGKDKEENEEKEKSSRKGRR